MQKKSIQEIQTLYNLELDKAITKIKSSKPKITLLQFPEGIKLNSSEVIKILEKETSSKFVVSGESCWGGCDIDLQEAKSLGADLIVHFGHAQFKKINFPIIYVNIIDNKNFTNLLKKSLSPLKNYKKIAVVSSIQHIHKLKEVKSFYESNKKKVKIPKALGHASVPGHIIGCEYSGLKGIKKENLSIAIKSF